MAALKKLKRRKQRKIKESSLEEWKIIMKDAQIEKNDREKFENSLSNYRTKYSFIPNKNLESIENIESTEHSILAKKMKRKRKTKTKRGEKLLQYGLKENFK